MSKKKRPHTKVVPITAPKQLPVLHGNAFITMLNEGQMLCNEVTARREYDEDVVEYLRQKGLFDEWAQWREAKRGPKQS